MFGGNFVRAIPDRDRMEPAWRQLRLTVNIATKLNRSHLMPGEISYLLPVMGRTEIVRTSAGQQALSIEDSLGNIHASRGLRDPASPHLLSEPRVVAEFAKAILAPNPKVDWDAWATDFSLVRAEISRTYPDIFHDYEARMSVPGGLQRPIPARDRIWKTPAGKAIFVTPGATDALDAMVEDPDMADTAPDVLRMITLRSNDQFNTTVYGYDDRFRGIRGTRMVVLMHIDDLRRLGLHEGQGVTLSTFTTRDDVVRQLAGLRVTAYDIPQGCVGTYYPEANVLMPLWHYAKGSKVPAAKSVPVRVLDSVNVAPQPAR